MEKPISCKSVDFGKNQLGDDSSGLPSRSSFVSKKHVPLKKNTDIGVLGFKIDQKSDPYLTLGFLTFQSCEALKVKKPRVPLQDKGVSWIREDTVQKAAQ